MGNQQTFPTLNFFVIRNHLLEAELSGQHCLGPVLVRFLSGFSGKFCLVSVRCPDFVRIRCQVSVCPDFVCRDSIVTYYGP